MAFKKIMEWKIDQQSTTKVILSAHVRECYAEIDRQNAELQAAAEKIVEVVNDLTEIKIQHADEIAKAVEAVDHLPFSLEIEGAAKVRVTNLSRVDSNSSNSWGT
jgi:CRISPR/Cas system CSM-associated protein Csm2 small subunit